MPPPFRQVPTVLQEMNARTGRDLRVARQGQAELARAWDLLVKWWAPWDEKPNGPWARDLTSMDAHFEALARSLAQLENDLQLTQGDLRRASRALC